MQRVAIYYCAIVLGVCGCGDSGSATSEPTATSQPMTGDMPTGGSTGDATTGPNPATETSDDGPTTSGPTSEPTSEPTATTEDPTDPTTGTTGEPDPDPTACAALDAPARGPVVAVDPSMAGMLPQLISTAEPDTTFVFADGTYDISGANLLHVTTPGLRFISESRDRSAVILDANYALGEIFLITASDVTIAHMTLQRALWHPIHATGGATQNSEHLLIYDVAVVDPGEQAIKVNPSGAGYYADFGTIACSSLIMTDAGRAQVKDCYTGGIDVHAALGWVVRDNYFEGFWCDQGLSEHAVHFWRTARDTLVERNTIVDCARGVGFGLGAQAPNPPRMYPDDPCPDADYLGHIDGEIRNNMIFAKRPELFASQSGFDSGVALEQACGARVYHNTVVSLQQPYVSIEYRWPNTRAEIVNNLVTHNIRQRDGAQAELTANLEDQGLDHFVDGANGDLQLVAQSSAIDAGDPVTLDWDATDYAGEPRDAAPDVGADEHRR